MQRTRLAVTGGRFTRVLNYPATSWHAKRPFLGGAARRGVFRCKSAAARCPGEHRNQDRKLVYTWRRRRQMVVTYGADPLSLSPSFSGSPLKSHPEYLRYGVSRFNISYCSRGPHPPERKNRLCNASYSLLPPEKLTVSCNNFSYAIVQFKSWTK